MQSKGEEGIKVLSWEIGNSIASNSKHLLSHSSCGSKASQLDDSVSVSPMILWSACQPGFEQGLGDPFLQWLAHMTVGQRPQFLTTLAPPQGCHDVFKTYLVINDSEERREEVMMPFLTQPQKSHSTTSTVSCYTGQLYSIWEGTT